MLDSIMDAVKGQVVSAITEKTGLDIGQAEQALPLAQESVTEGRRRAAPEHGVQRHRW